MTLAPTAIGVDIGGTHLRAARVDAEGRILARARDNSASDPETVLERIVALIGGIDAPGVVGIGVGVPGRVDFAARRVVSGGYVDLSKIDLAARLEAAFHRPVVIDNDCSMALVAESAVGAGKGAGHIVMLTIGTGIGGAAMENGRIVRSRGTAGQFGHICIDPQGVQCVCGKRGCVETTSSGTALGRHVRKAGLPAGTTVDELLARLRKSDRLASNVLAAWATPLRIAVDDLVAVLDPDVVVLGGGLGEAAAAALEEIGSAPSWYESRIAAAALGDDAGVIGAALASLPQPARPKRLVMVNGVPASGKSGVAAALSQVTGWPLLSLDTVKNPFLEEIEGVDRPFNRKLGRASMKAMFALLAEAPAGTTAIMDAWFGFQPREFVETLVAQARIDAVTEVWCTAPPEIIGARYGARAQGRRPGHPGADYVAELIDLAKRAQPFDHRRRYEVDTTQPLDVAALKASVTTALG